MIDKKRGKIEEDMKMEKIPSEHTKEEELENQEPEGGAGTPRWVKVFGIILISAILLVFLAKLISGGEHGPGRHFQSDAEPTSIENGELQL
jgi:hypothetical protein